MRKVTDFLNTYSVKDEFTGWFEMDKLGLWEDGDIHHYAYLRTMSVFYSSQSGYSDFEQSPKHEREEVYAGLFVCHDNQLHINIGLEKNFLSPDELHKNFKIALLYPYSGNKPTQLLLDHENHGDTLRCLSWDCICDYIFETKPMFHFYCGLDHIGPHGESISHLFTDEVA